MFAQPRRLISAGIAIVLGVAFVAAALILGSTFQASFHKVAAKDVGDSTVVVSAKPGEDPATSGISKDFVEQLKKVPGVDSVRAKMEVDLQQELDGREGTTTGRSLPRDGEDATLSSGRLPSATGEVVVSHSLAKSRQVKLGQEITLFGETQQPAKVRVVGIFAERQGAEKLYASVYASDADLATWSGKDRFQNAYVMAPSVDQATLRDQVKKLSGASSLQIRTGQEEIKERMKVLSSAGKIVTGLLLGFAAISVLVSSIVIANTFSILIAQRIRELALLRCIGATRRQVFGSVLKEAVALSTVASLVGILLGFGAVGLVSLLSQEMGVEFHGIHFSATDLLVPLFVGVTVTTLSAVLPARQATKVAPMAALRPQIEPLKKSRSGKIRISVGVLFALGGFAMVAGGASAGEAAWAGGGAALSLIGVIMLGALVVPAMAGLIGVLPSRFGGIPGQLAVDNARRNPSRSAATSSALLVGVTLITLLTVSITSAQQIIEQELDKVTPVDVIVTSAGGNIPASAADKVRNVSGVTTVSSPLMAQVKLQGKNAKGVETSTDRELFGVSAENGKASRAAEVFSDLKDGVVILPSEDGFKDGSTISVKGPDGRSVSLTTLVRPRSGDLAIVTESTLRQLTPKAQNVLWARYADGTDTAVAQERISEALKGVPAVQIGGAAALRAQFDTVVQMLLALATGMLGVSVLIALVGISNTLSLSVLERTQESGLLRALGITRRQLRRMLGVEAVLLASVGVVLGLVLGTFYGFSLLQAAVGDKVDVPLNLPWGTLLGVTVVALLAGWAASVLPGRRAAKVPPSAALAAE
ncbi:putative ABC transport system permease protein [Austwickia chelonae]|uniref:Putative ABC transporter permease protein n=1 Tax=Austwickia chelonae NBRC 105200 TaxID=1184607 RepID=K6VPL5_9MICO|nr:ABC transporter permease [Austwickia chelonae]GAB78679.1 putative ABC transporter permease protein [Austwickia chelonae NBRC 105200]SEW34658.1 putative ABC transport system permease protein [Austwickia chelonae]